MRVGEAKVVDVVDVADVVDAEFKTSYLKNQEPGRSEGGDFTMLTTLTRPQETSRR
jgi:hypothetical protein